MMTANKDNCKKHYQQQQRNANTSKQVPYLLFCYLTSFHYISNVRVNVLTLDKLCISRSFSVLP